MDFGFNFFRPDRVIVDRHIDDLSEKDGQFRILPTPPIVECKPFPVFGSANFRLNLTRHLPKRSLSTIKNCIVHGRTAALFTLAGLRGATHWAALPELSLTAHPSNYSEFFCQSGKSWRFSAAPKLIWGRTFAKGILIGSRYSFNYFHFMSDSMVRAIISDEYNEYKDWPIVITRSADQISQLVNIAFPGRQIISLETEELVRFDSLVVPISSSFSPDDPGQISAAVFDVPYLGELRSRLRLQHPHSILEKQKIIYIKRPTYIAPDGAMLRTIVNENEVISFIDQFNSYTVSPESLSISEQREIFTKADIIIGMAGSAFANLIFCRPGTTVILICQNRTVSPEYFGMMCGELGLRYIVLACTPIDRSNPHPAHLSVTVDISTLSEVLEFVRSS